MKTWAFSAFSQCFLPMTNHHLHKATFQASEAECLGNTQNRWNVSRIILSLLLKPYFRLQSSESTTRGDWPPAVLGENNIVQQCVNISQIMWTQQKEGNGNVVTDECQSYVGKQDILWHSNEHLACFINAVATANEASVTPASVSLCETCWK